MLDAVVLDGDFPFRPTHVDTNMHGAVFVGEADLRLRWRKACTNQHQPDPALLWGLGASVDES